MSFPARRRDSPSGRFRPEWYDRNPVSQASYYNANGVAPHALTKRLTYTVPTGKKAMVELLSCKLVRDAVATAVGLVYAYMGVTPFGGTSKRILLAVVLTNVVGDKDEESGASNIMLQSGDEFEGWTVDLSTGGAFTYHLSYKITEFNGS